jgi:hypothetical protein
MLTRRSFAQNVALLAVPSALRGLPAYAALPVPPKDAITCRVMRKGEDIGLAEFKFERQSQRLEVHIAIDLVVKLGPIPVFRYSHRNLETWEGDNLVGLDAKTDDDGTPKYMSAKLGPNGLMVTGSKTKPYIAPPNALGTSYWNIRSTSCPLINTEDGHLMDINVTPVGLTEVPLASGADVTAKEFAIRGEVKIDLWYQPSEEFASMRYYAKDGSVVTYARL